MWIKNESKKGICESLFVAENLKIFIAYDLDICGNPSLIIKSSSHRVYDFALNWCISDTRL